MQRNVRALLCVKPENNVLPFSGLGFDMRGAEETAMLLTMRMVAGREEDDCFSGDSKTFGMQLFGYELQVRLGRETRAG